MRKKLSTTAYATLLTAGLVVAAPIPAFASPETSGSGGVGSGNQVSVPAEIEAKICGNSVAALGYSKAKCKEVAKALYASSDKGGAKTDGSGGVASGNQIIMPVDAAVEVCGNSAAVAGVSKAKCVDIVKGVASSSKNEGGAKTDGSGGVASGNQIIIPVDVAVEVCGNSVSVAGTSKADCTKVVKAMSSSSDNEGGAKTDGSGGVASGNQVIVPADVAVEICGNAVSAVGIAKADCIKKISDGKGGDDGNGSDDNGGDDSDDNGNGGDNGSDKGDDNGKDNGKDSGKDSNGDDKGKDSGKDSADEGAESGDDAEVDLVADDKNASGGLPVTGAALGGLVAAGIAALGGGAAAMRFARKRKAAANTDAEV
ncbi:chaplin family protein [Nocardiopsis rhodophaea]